ncbi:MAG: ester cyclase [Thermoleophilia bacterium]
MSAEDNKRVMRRLVEEVWDQGRLETIDEIYSPDFVSHNPGPSGSGIEALKQDVLMMRRGFPDLRTVELDLLAEGDKVAARYWAVGTHKGEIMGAPATDRAVCMGGISIARFEDGRIVETWESFDTAGVLEQIGLVELAGRPERS